MELSTDPFLPVDEVAQVVKQLRIVFSHHVCPGEGTVLTLRSNVQQIKAPDVSRDPCVLGHVSKHSYPPALREFPILIIQVLWTKDKDSNHILPSLPPPLPLSLSLNGERPKRLSFSSLHRSPSSMPPFWPFFSRCL